MQETAIIVAIGAAMLYAYDYMFANTWSQRNA